jgi:hypothetical protein
VTFHHVKVPPQVRLQFLTASIAGVNSDMKLPGAVKALTALCSIKKNEIETVD